MKKWQKYSIIAGATLAASGLIVVPAVIPLTKSNTENIYKPNEPQPKPQLNFSENWQEYSSKITPATKVTIFNNNTNEGYKPWCKLPDDPNDAIYQNLFSKIDLKVVFEGLNSHRMFYHHYDDFFLLFHYI